MALFERDFSEFIPLWPEESEETVLARMIASANEGLDESSDRWVDTREGGHWRTCVVPGSREIARLYDFAGTEAVAAAFVIWAWSDYLDDHGEVRNVFRLAATFATGRVLFKGPGDTLIAAGTTVNVPPVDLDADAASFETQETVTIYGPLDPPTGLAGAPQSTGGTLSTAHHFYVVTAIDDGPAPAAIGETLPSPEIDVDVSGPSGSVALTWDELPGATGYRVYRSEVTGGPYTLLAEVTAPSYTDTGAEQTGNPPGANTTGGAVYADVRATETGAFGNVAAGAVTELAVDIGGVTVTNPQPMLGGADPEADDFLRERILEAFQQKGAGSARDYRAWARAYPGVGRVTVIPLWDGPGTVKVIVSDINGDPVSPDTVAGLQQLLDPIPNKAEGDAPVGAQVTVATATAVGLDIGATVEFDSGYSLDGALTTIAVQNDIETAVNRYIDSVEPGQEVVIQKIAAAIVRMAGVHDVGNVTINGTAGNHVMNDDPPEVPFVSAFNFVEGSLP